jgi:hypothetical protein
MTPKEKAKDLVDKYFTTGYAINLFYAKQCALITVDEIINSINPFGMFLGKDYWQEVKQEIEKL